MIGQPFAEWRQRYTCTGLRASKVYALERERERKKEKVGLATVGYARAWSLGARALWLKGKEEESGCASRAHDFIASQRDSLSHSHRPPRAEERETLIEALGSLSAPGKGVLNAVEPATAIRRDYNGQLLCAEKCVDIYLDYTAQTCPPLCASLTQRRLDSDLSEPGERSQHHPDRPTTFIRPPNLTAPASRSFT
ncbi:hypothetical protein SRHO_G00120880 [Serrasalmus rhombeus]